MAKRGTRGPGSGMTRNERLAGFCYLPFYLVLLSLLLQMVLPHFGVTLSESTLNFLYFTINFAAVLLIFHHFLLESFRGTRFWSFLQTLILGLAFYYALLFVLNFLLLRLAPDLVNPNEAAVESLAKISGAPMLACIILIGPFVEEVLMRGLIFGSLHRHSRIAAYIVSILIFSAIHLWQYALDISIGTLLLSALQYVPGGIALAWTYEKSGSIWTSITLHCVINAVSMGVLTLI